MSYRSVMKQESKLSEFREKMKAERERSTNLLDLEYWTAICFETREQAEAFAAWCGDAFDGKHVDGVALAGRLGADIGPRFSFPGERSVSPRLAALASEVPPDD